ncbi:MAG: hypothetical protein CMM23_12225 [Rhodospirillaceae bacterium]|nr:hypothetical protein [Rhodospirillaceae bacterium]
MICYRATMKFPMTIRIDQSDQYIFDNPAQSGEWAVSGAFVFAGGDRDPANLDGADEIAFATAFMGTASFGWSTFVIVQEIEMADFETVVETLTDHFMAHYIAPNRDAAMTAAREEADFAASLCDHPLGTLLGIERSIGDDGVTEQFRIVDGQAESAHGVAWNKD